MITSEMLRRIMPRLTPDKCDECLPHLQRAMAEFGINSPLREAAFLAQIAHESGQFRFMEEIWGPTDAQRRYEPQTELSRQLGNNAVGDGKRFKGRGPIQITGRANYAKFGQLLGLDIVSDPALAASLAVGFRIAGLFWQKNGLNQLADQEMFKTITKRINGGFNGLEDRQKFYDLAKSVLGVRATTGVRSLRGAGRDTGDDSLIPRFTRGLDSAGEITPAAKRVKKRGKIKKAVAAGRKRAIKKKGKAKKLVAKKAAKAGRAASSSKHKVKARAKKARKTG